MPYADRILAHYEAVWQASGTRCEFGRGPVENLPPSFGVFCFAPRPSRNAWTYATAGMSTSTDAERLEMHILSPQPSNSIVELLYAAAHFHRTAQRLGCMHTVNFGRPWLVRASSEYGYISKPYLDGPALEWAEIEQDMLVQFCWLIPITKDERDFKALNGAAAFEEALERAHVDCLDPRRLSVVTPPICN